MKIIIKDMSCEHCLRKIDGVLRDNNIASNINLAKKEVVVATEHLEKAVDLIKSIGYTPYLCE